MLNAGLDKPQAGIRTARRNINNLGYADGNLKTLYYEIDKDKRENIQTT